MNDVILHTSNLTIGYKRSRRATRIVASDISASLNTGELVCLLGANGVGKSTLLRTLAGMQSPINGKRRGKRSSHLHQMRSPIY